MRPAPTPHSRHGFTLIELLTVIAIIGILAAIIIPVVGKVRLSAQNAKVVSNLRQIGVGHQLYAASNRDFIPWVNEASAALGGGSPWERQISNYMGSGINVNSFVLNQRPPEFFQVPRGNFVVTNVGAKLSDYSRSRYINVNAASGGVSQVRRRLNQIASPARTLLVTPNVRNQLVTGAPASLQYATLDPDQLFGGGQSVPVLYADGHVASTAYADLAKTSADSPWNPEL